MNPFEKDIKFSKEFAEKYKYLVPILAKKNKNYCAIGYTCFKNREEFLDSVKSSIPCMFITRYIYKKIKKYSKYQKINWGYIPGEK